MPNLSRRKQNATRRLKPTLFMIYGVLLVFFIVAGAWLISDLQQGYLKVIADTSQIAMRRSQILGQSLSTRILATDYVLRDVLGRINEDDLVYPDGNPGHSMRMSALLKEKADTVPDFFNMVIFNQDCVFTATATGDHTGVKSKQELCDARKMHRGPGPLASYVPGMLAASGRPALVLSRHLISPTGEFQGGVLGVIELDRAQQLFNSLNPDLGDSIGLLDDNQVLLARQPLFGEATAKRVATPEIPDALRSTASWASVTPQIDIDGCERLFGFSRIEGLPFIFAYGFDKAKAIGGWQRRSVELTAGYIATFLLALLVARFLWTTLRQREELAVSRDEAENANRAKSEFLANMSHEIRTPINAILGLSSILSRSDLNRDQMDCLSKLSQSGKLLLSIVNDILDYSKIEAGRLELESSEFSLRQMLNTIATIVSSDMKSKDIDVLIGAAADVPDILVGDTLRLQQILINLSGNALKFTEKGQVVVQVSIASQTHHTVSLRFEVRDTGIGISPDAVRRLFAPFSQADASTTRRFGGTGLGLAICGKLARLMGGEIGVESELNLGSTFWFTASFGIGKATPEVTKNGACCPSGELSVLIVDDSPVARTIIRDTVTSLGWRADCAEGGQEALEKIKDNQHYEIILVDWRMPGMDGLETIRAIRSMQTQSRMPIIAMVTAFDRDDVLKVDVGELVDTILVKPLTGSMLYDFVARSCKNSTLIDDRLSNGHRVEQRLAALSVLLVEDNTINQEVARRILELEHAIVAIANNGQEAVAILQKNHGAFDLVLMDMQMPIMDGYEATRIIRTKRCLPDLPIIALTAGVMASDRQQAEAAGVNGFISKPFDIDFLVSTVEKYCGHQRERTPPISLPDNEHNLIFDITDALRRTGGNHELCQGLLVKFIEQYRFISGDLERLTSAGDVNALIKYLHLVRGVSGNIGARHLSKIARDAESNLRNNIEHIQSHDFSLLINVANQTLESISAYLEGCSSESSHQLHQNSMALELNDLRMLLKANDITAIDAFLSLRESLATHFTIEQYERIRHAIDALDFQTALRHLTEEGPDNRQ